ncbi:MAG: hypothetical protein LBD95_02465 [Clostridiales Family XIII bacterium]|jgi:hypothetical protein|nr:hypothetical protein [Clostridiales Family XIII bacterium]
MSGRGESPRALRLSEGEAPLRVELLICAAGDDVQLYIGGGERSHIGGVAVSLPRESLDGSGRASCTTSVYNLLGHKDDGPAVMFAEAFCEKFACVAVASAGIHLDGARPEDVETFLRLSERLLKRALAEWDAARRGGRD